jgi:hypothetical protein
LERIFKESPYGTVIAIKVSKNPEGAVVMKWKNTGYLALISSFCLLILLMTATSGFSATLLYKENFDDKNFNAVPFGYLEQQCDDSKGEGNGTCESNEYSWVTGRGGSGYAYAGAQDVATITLWQIDGNWQSLTGSNEIYSSFWMRYSNFSQTDSHENIKYYYPKFGSGSGSVEGITSSANESYVIHKCDSSSTYKTFYVATTGHTNGSWHHYEFYHNLSTGNMKFWYDGVLKVNSTFSGCYSSSSVNYLTLGSIDAEEAGTFKREFDDWEVWSGMPSGSSDTSGVPQAPSILSIN